MSEKNIQSNPTAAADTPQPLLTAEEMLAQLRALLPRIPDVPALTVQERRLLQKSSGRRLTDAEIVASLDVARMSDRVAQAIGTSATTGQQAYDDAQNWGPVEREVRGVLKAVADANLVRRQRASIVALQAYAIGQELARDPENAGIVPHVLEVKRLKGLRRRKTTSATDTPPPVHSPSVANAPSDESPVKA